MLRTMCVGKLCTLFGDVDRVWGVVVADLGGGSDGDLEITV